MDSRSARWATRLYGRVLRLLPTDVYHAYAPEMSQDFRELTERARRSAGVAGMLMVLLRSVLDVVWRAVLERRQLEAAEYVSERVRLPVGERMSIFGQELRLAARGMLKRPGFTLVTVLTLALGIGANTAIFAVVNAALIRPLPYPESERVVWLLHHAPGLNLPDMENSPGTFRLYRTYAKSFSSLASLQIGQRNLTGSGEPARVTVLEASPSLFDVLRLQPVLGRRLREDDAQPGAPAVALLTHRGWQTRFAGSRTVVGRTVQLDGATREIVGVLPKAFTHPDPETEVLIPMVRDPNAPFGAFGMGGMARLAPGVTLAQAQQEVSSIQSRIPELYPDVRPEFLKNAGWRASIQTMRDRLVSDAETALWVVLGTVGFLLLVACASVANLFLVRAESRHREVGVRIALGATRRRVAATFLSESLVVGLAGGVWGVLLAALGVRALVDAGPAQLPRLHEVNIDLRVVLFALAVSLTASILFAILPLPQLLRRPLHGLVRGGRGHTGGRERQRVRKTLIVAQIALAVVLVTGSGLMLRSFQRLRAVDPGFQPEGVLTIGVSLREPDKVIAAASYHRMLAEVRALPGVQHAGATNSLPLRSDGLNGSSFNIESKPRAEGALPPVGMFAAISENYLQAIGTRLLQGRGIERADLELKRAVVLVDESFARSFLGGKAIGERIRFGSDSTWLEIVGVVDDVHMFGLREPHRPMAYLPMTTSLSSVQTAFMNIVIRTSADPSSLAGPARAAIKRAAPNTPITTTRTMQDVTNESMAETSFTMTVLLIAAIVALLLGAIGLYGVISFVVTQRTSEIGVRIALGAVPHEVRTMVLRQGIVLGSFGVAVGLLAAAALTRVLESLLFQIDSRDPLTFSLVPAVMLTVSALAVYWPARRASAVSPLQALRGD
ncbi:MAG: ABC transporter permease [Longimicrobiales bacterium]